MFSNTQTFTVSLLPDRPMAQLIAYVAGTSESLPFNDKRKAMLIIPGGAYWLQSDAEADPVAHFFLAEGYNTFILRYSVGRGVDSRWPWPLAEASAAMKYIRDHAEALHIDPEQVFVAGFSAGGHLAAALGMLWDDDDIEAMLGMEKGYNKPTAMVLAYPVISGLEWGHRGSINNILKADRDDEEARRSVSLELHVSEKTVPCFIWATRTDADVPVQNTILFAKALADAKVPFELHIYPRGPHALSIGTELVGCAYPEVSVWTDDALRFFEQISVK